MWLKKYFRHLLELSDARLFVIRYAVNFFVLIEILLLPFLLDPDFYIKIEYLKYFFVFLPVVLFGVNTGYLYGFYSEGENLQNAMLVFCFLIGILAALVAIPFSGDALLPIAIILFLLTMPLEKILVVKKRFILASIYKPLISLALILTALLLNFFEIRWDAARLYLFSVVIAISIWILIILAALKPSGIKDILYIRAKLLIRQMLFLVQNGFLLSTQSFILIGYFLFDRTIVNTYYEGNAAEYAISFSFSQAVFIGMNTIAFVAQQKVGNSISQITLKSYSRQVNTTLSLCAILIFFSSTFVSVFDRHLMQYGYFFNSYLTISSIVGAYYAISAFAIVALYKKLTHYALGVLLVALVVNIAATYTFTFFDFGYMSNLIKSCCILLASAIALDLKIRKRLALDDGGYKKC